MASQYLLWAETWRMYCILGHKLKLAAATCMHVHQSLPCESAVHADCILPSRQAGQLIGCVLASVGFVSDCYVECRHECHRFTPCNLVMEKPCSCRHEPANTRAITRPVFTEAELSSLPIFSFSNAVFTQATCLATLAQWGHRSIGESVWYSQNGSARTQNRAYPQHSAIRRGEGKMLVVVSVAVKRETQCALQHSTLM